jgi:autotransporter-associated beta strand protein
VPVIDTGVFVAAGQTMTSNSLYTGCQQLVKRGPGTLILATGNSHSGGTVVEAGRVVVATIAALGSGGLRVAGGARLVSNVGAAEIRVSSLVVDAGGGIDLGAGRITVAAGGFTTAGIVALITTGLNGGDWAGTTGITSGLAAATPDRCVGYAPNDDGSLTVAFAASGDTNLDGLIDTLDVANIAAAGLFDSGIATAWWQGDINYDGFVDILDLSALLGSGLYDEASYLPSGLSAREAAFASHDASPPA